MNYITYSEYAQMGGALIPEQDFERVARTASRKVDSLTFGRVAPRYDKLTAFQKERLQEAMFYLCDFEYENSDVLNSAIKSYTLNGVSITYGQGEGTVLVDGVLVNRLSYQILQQTGLTCRIL